MDFCTRCGNELTSGDQICGKCGKDVRAKRASVEFIHDHPKEEHVKGAIDEGMDQKQKKRLVIIVVIGFVLFLILLFWGTPIMEWVLAPPQSDDLPTLPF